MQMISSNANILRAFQNLSDNENFVLSKDGSNLHKTSTWQDIKNYFGTSGAKALNQRTIEGLRNLFAHDPLYAGAKDVVKAELDSLSASGGAVSGKFVRELFTKLNLAANIDNLKKSASNHLATLLAPAPEEAEKTELQQKLDQVRQWQEDYRFVDDLDVSIKKSVENLLIKELLDNTDGNGVLNGDHRMSTVEDKLNMILDDIIDAHRTRFDPANLEDTRNRLKASFSPELYGVTDVELAQSHATLLQQSENGRPQNAQTRATMQFALPDSIAKHPALEMFSVPKEAMLRVYTLERQMMTMTDDGILTELDAVCQNRNMSTLVRMAHNPQFLTDKTAYLKGKALIAANTYPVEASADWGKCEADRKKGKFCKSVMADPKLREENAKFAQETFGLNPDTAIFKKVVDQMMRMSAQAAFKTFVKVCIDMSDAYIGKRPKDVNHANIHLPDPLMPPAADYAAAKTMSPKVLEKLVRMFNGKSGDVQFARAVPVFMARVFNVQTIDKLNGYEGLCKDKQGKFDEVKYDQMLTDKISSYMQEAIDVIEVFGDDTNTIDALCFQMNYPSTNGDMQGSALSRRAIEALRDRVATVTTWASGVLKAGRPIDANAILLLHQSAVNSSTDPELSKYGTGIDEMAMGMVKTLGGFRIGNKTELKSLIKVGQIDKIICDLAKNYGEKLKAGGLVNLQKKVLEEEDDNLTQDDAPNCVLCAAIASESLQQLDLLGTLVTILHFPMGSDEGVDYDIDALCGELKLSGFTSNTSEIPMPGFEEDGDSIPFGKRSLFVIQKAGEKIMSPSQSS